MDDNETSLALVPTSRKKRNTAERQARTTTASISTRAPSSQTQHFDGNSSSGEDGIDDEEYANYDDDAPDQDEDVIRDAEDAQQTDLVEAAQSAELELTVKDYERKAASTALAKVSLAITIKRVSIDRI
jgi:hypothetical protein